MPRSSGRGYVEPLAAIAAVFAVAAGLTLYAGGLGDALGEADRPVAETVLEEVRGAADDRGVVEPVALARAEPPGGWQANVTLSTRAGRFSRGPTPPADADRATARVAVRLGPGTIRPGRLTVEAWR